MLLGFKERFKQPILDGTKKFTIRERRKIESKIGETLYMYTGLRTSECEKITDKHKLVSIQLVDIEIKIGMFSILVSVSVDGRHLRYDELLQFYICDGFNGEVDFVRYWTLVIKRNENGLIHLRKKDLVLYHWTYLRI